MPQLTIDLPEAAMPWLTRQAENENTTPERFLISHVLCSMARDESELIYADPAQKHLEDILEERLKGPFIEITDLDALKERVMAKALARVHQRSCHA